MEIAKLEKVDVRKLWKNEARDFTPWLESNIEALSEALNLDLTVVKREKGVGPFAADIMAEDRDGRTTIIENELEQSDHDHLGKVLTYLTNLEAKCAVWVSTDPRPEHARAMAWLNESTPDDIAFYLVRVEAYRIAGSPPAPFFSVIVRPSAETKESGGQIKELARRHVLRREFWTEFLQRARERTNLYANTSPTTSNWVGTGASRSGLSLDCLIRMHDAGVELYIDRGPDLTEENKAIFDQLAAKKQEIEQAFGGALEWDRGENKRSCKIFASVGKGGLLDRECWATVQDAITDAMIRLHKAVEKPIQALKIKG